MLEDIVIDTKEIRVGEKSFRVHGITLEDLAALFRDGARSDLDDLIATVKPLMESGQDVEMFDVLQMLLPKVPVLMARLIATAAAEPASYAKVRMLPLSVQFEALRSIGELTFAGEYTLKNFAAGLMDMMTGVTGAVNQMTEMQPTGTQTLDDAPPSSDPKAIDPPNDTQ
jgi:hypothetical protein